MAVLNGKRKDKRGPSASFIVMATAILLSALGICMRSYRLAAKDDRVSDEEGREGAVCD